MNLTGKKILIRNGEESRKAQYLLFLFGYCWWSMRSNRGWKYNIFDNIVYIYQEDSTEKLLRHEEACYSHRERGEEITIDQLIKQIGEQINE